MHMSRLYLCMIWWWDTLVAPKTKAMQAAEWATGMRRTVDASPVT